MRILVSEFFACSRYNRLSSYNIEKKWENWLRAFSLSGPPVKLYRAHALTKKVSQRCTGQSETHSLREAAEPRRMSTYKIVKEHIGGDDARSPDGFQNTST